MADEFVDFYEILELPLDAERSEVRKRISELYIEAQKNLDHRNFDKRVKFQQLFEITLPQARYILLDDGRRDDYDRIVKASRAPDSASASAAPVAKAKAEQSTEISQEPSGSFKLSSDGPAGQAPSIDALPESEVDPETAAREREELWNKWKSGLQTAMEREAAKDKSREKATVIAPTPLADRIEAVEAGAPQPSATDSGTIGAEAAPASAAQTAPASKPRAERPKVKFNFGGEPDNTPRRGEGAPTPGAEEFVEEAKGRLSPEQIEERRVNHKRAIIQEELENTGAKGMFIGAAAVILPGLFAMYFFMSTYYPGGRESTLPLKSSGVAWLLWIVLLGGLAYCAAYFLSKSMRRKQGMELQMMSYENLLRHTNKDY